MPSSFDAFPILFVAFGVLVVALIIFAIIAEGKRKDRLASFAQSLGWTWYPGPFAVPGAGFWEKGFFGPPDADLPLFPVFEGFEPFGEGHSQQIKNVIAGTWEGLEWQVFDYEYETGTGDDKRSYSYWVLAARLPLQLPPLTLSPENLGTKLGQLVGIRDIKFELDEFNRTYYVQCDEPKAAYDIISPQMIEYLMSIDPRDWQMSGPYVVLHELGSQEPDNTMIGMQQIRGFYERIPNYVRQDGGYQPR